MRFLKLFSVAVFVPLALCLSYELDNEQVTLDYHQPFEQEHEHANSGIKDPLDECFDEKVNWALEHYRVPGLAISLVQNGSTFAKGYGYANLSSHSPTPATNKTLFYAGSTTKAHIAAALSLLITDNEKYPTIQWETTLQSILPEFQLSDPLVAAQITISDILSHRTGLPRHDMILLQNLSRKKVVQRLKYLPLTKGIRAEFQYCNLMYIVAAYLIETVTGVDIEVFMTENLWNVLGMKNTFFTPDSAKEHGLEADIAEGYWLNPASNRTIPTGNIYNPSLTGAGNILTSVTDYALWISALLNHVPPISETGYNMLFSAQSIILRHSYDPFSSPLFYGLGWMIQSYKGETIIFHDGAQDGFGAFVLLVPRRGLGVSILGNQASGTNSAAQVLAFELVDRLLGVEKSERFNWVAVIDAGLQLSKLTNTTLDALYPNLPDKSSLLPHPLSLASYEGVYTHPAYPAISISSTCRPFNPTTPTPSKWTGSHLCGSFQDIIDMATSNLTFDFLHITGQYWTLVMEAEGMQDGTRVEFDIAPEGLVSKVGIEFEVTMREKKGKIWFERESHVVNGFEKRWEA
ncbi:beta-lactamase/transpeptidase-like protein [Aspergillus stella-maris]|uniref:beta-lactamase/transpeptidase-like protein n=1 Tax=Aspergillus stella-maris TaxID=1810926 RepID=UPI003CCDC107